nr:hypothetical protein Iba_chr09bCG5730 [Ipomoea batatas]
MLGYDDVDFENMEVVSLIFAPKSHEKQNDLVINEISEDDVNDFRDQIRLLSLMPSDPKNAPLDGETEEKILRNVKSIIIWEDSELLKKPYGIVDHLEFNLKSLMVDKIKLLEAKVLE